LKIFSHLANKYQFPVVYANQVGGNDDIVFDGNSKIVLPDGSILAKGNSFAEDLVVAEMEKESGEKISLPEEEAEVLRRYRLFTGCLYWCAGLREGKCFRDSYAFSLHFKRESGGCRSTG